jgi:hypothetical protein
MWVWMAMRCFFDVDCTSSILIAATGRRRRRFLRAVSLEPLSRRNNFGRGGRSGGVCWARNKSAGRQDCLGACLIRARAWLPALPAAMVVFDLSDPPMSQAPANQISFSLGSTETQIHLVSPEPGRGRAAASSRSDRVTSLTLSSRFSQWRSG